jgi:cathepsin X
MRTFFIAFLAVICSGCYIPTTNLMQHIIHPLPTTPVEELPKHLFWGNFNGTNYLIQSRNQHIPEYCGACWSFAVSHSFSDRLKIARKGAFPDILVSPQVLLSCNKENAGCYGGDQLSAFRFIAQYGITDESCSPYQARGFTNGLDCSEQIWCQTCDHGNCQTPRSYKKWYATEYGLAIGEEEMLRELQRGPIACNFAAGGGFHEYTQGIYEDTTGNLNVDHTVSVVGYGEENGVKYWIVRNSWGTYFGEGGFFRLVRGKNNLAIESYCAWGVPNAEPELVENPFYKEKIRPYFDDTNEINKNCVSSKLEFSKGEKLVNLRSYDLMLEEELPSTWDWRNVSGTNYLSTGPNENTLSYCSSCWAHAVIDSLSDRFNILRNSEFPKILLSSQVLINCNAGGNCGGGNPGKVYEFLYEKGVPDDTCQPYTGKDPETHECSEIQICKRCKPVPPKIGQTSAKCIGLPNPRRYYVSEYGKVTGASNMKAEIFLNGPISCGMQITDKFTDYKGGVYSEYNEDVRINHEVSIVGWGKEQGTEYWIVRINWGSYWGEEGMFRIKMYRDNLGVESECSWGIPSYQKHEEGK